MAQGLWTSHAAAFSPRSVFPPWDFFFLGSSLPLLVALLLRPDRRRTWSVGLAFDFAIVALLSLHIVVYIALGHAFFGGVQAYSRFASFLNSLRGLVMPALALWLLRGAQPPWRSTYRQIGAAIVLWNVGDALSSALFWRGLYRPGSLDLPWTLPFVWLALAARAGPRVAAAEADELVPDWRGSRRGTLLVVLGTAGVCFGHFTQVLLGSDPPDLVRQRSALTFLALVILVALLLVRQLRLLSRLEDATRAEVETRVRLQRTERMSAVGMLVAGVAHEINNPLTAILGHAELLQRRPLEPVDPGKIEQIREAAERCARIVRNLLLFARDTGAERSALDLASLAGRVAELEANGLRVRSVKLELDLAPGTRVVGNEGQLQQVLVNLLTNGLHAITLKPGAHRLRLSVRPFGPSAVVEVEDDGPGIKAELREEVFKPLYTTKPPGEGTGLGLAICRDIVTSHGGSLTASSGVFGGALLRILLPLADVPAPAPPRVLPTPHHLAGLRVLAVDDEASLREVMAQILEDEGCEVRLAADGESALEALDFGPQVVVSDVRMPGLGGARFYARCLERRPDLVDRFVFVTGDTASRETWEFLADSGCETLQKPFAAKALVAAVQRVVQRAAVRPVEEAATLS